MRSRLRSTVPIGPHQRRGPRKGMFTQCVCILLDRVPTLGEVGGLLSGFTVLGEAAPAEGEHGWAMGGPSLTVDYRDEVNGKTRIDVVNQPWPDAMGSPDREPILFAAWSMGHFGPTTYPGSLERALLHRGHEMDIAARIRGFVRIRTSYVFAAGEHAPVMPEHYDALDELRFVSEIQLALADLPGVLALFNPNGELLTSAARLEAALGRDRAGGALPVDAWVNVRRYRPNELHGEWLVHDTVGMGQLDVVDHQASLPREHPSQAHASALLYSMAAYDAVRGGVLGPGDTATDDHGTGWCADWAGEALIGPPRPVLAWAPDDVELPAELEGEEGAEA